MRLRMQVVKKDGRQSKGSKGFTLVETAIATMLASIMLSALYASFACGFGTVRISREELRATEIMLERLERVRVCSFDQVTNASVNPPAMITYYDPTDKAIGGGGVEYTVTFSNRVPTVAEFPSSPYRTNILLVTVGCDWTSGNVQHKRTMQTLVAKDGLWTFVQKGQYTF